MFEQLIT